MTAFGATSELEIRIRSALQEYADAFPAARAARIADKKMIDVQPRRWRIAAASAACVLVIIAIAIVSVVVRDSGTSSRNDQLPMRGDFGSEIPVSVLETTTEDLQAAEAAAPAPSIPGITPVTVQPEGGSAVTVTAHGGSVTSPRYQYCALIHRRAADGDTEHPASECGRPVLQVFESAQQQAGVIYVWPTVPPDAEYVTFASNSLDAWQRPMPWSATVRVPTSRIAVFPVPDAPTDATLTAYDSAGRRRGTAHVNAATSTSANNSVVGSVSTGDCDNSSLADPYGNIRVYDHATGTDITVNFLESCLQATSGGKDSAALQSIGVSAGYGYDDGVKVTYYEDSTGKQLSEEDVERRLAAAKGGR